MELPKESQKLTTVKYSLGVILGVIVFTCVEKIIRFCGFGHNHNVADEQEEGEHRNHLDT